MRIVQDELTEASKDQILLGLIGLGKALGLYSKSNVRLLECLWEEEK